MGEGSSSRLSGGRFPHMLLGGLSGREFRPNYQLSLQEMQLDLGVFSIFLSNLYVKTYQNNSVVLLPAL